MKRNKILVIVHGGLPRHYKNKILEKARRFLLSELSSPRGILKKDYSGLSKYLEPHYDEVKIFKWDGKLSVSNDIIPASKDLETYLLHRKKHKIDIIAVSLGGFVVQNALEHLKKVKINRLIFVGAVHNGHHRLKNVQKMINVYSLKDKMFIVANDFYEGFGNMHLEGPNVLNIILKNLRHDELCLNKLLEGEDIPEKSLFDLYKRLLLSE